MNGGANYHQGGFFMGGKWLFGGAGDNLMMVSVKSAILPIIYGLEEKCVH
jgi:hypothetical protein